jgi:hypothetical protein
MRSRALLAGLLTALAPLAEVRGDEPRVTALEGVPREAALRLADADGDGRVDVLALAGRELVGWGGTGGVPAAAPRWRLTLPDDVSAVDVARERRPALLALGEAASFLLPLGAGLAAETIAGAGGLGWRDGGRAIFVDLHPSQGDAACVLPGSDGWSLRRAAAAALEPLGLGARRSLAASGAFLEDSAKVTHGLPRLLGLATRGPGPASVALWALAGERLLRVAGAARDAYDLAFLPAKGERSLRDLDGDGVPELLHRDGENREARYAWFRLPAAPTAGAAPAQGAIGPPFSFLRLSGFNLEPAYVDLNGDGRLDFVVTTIEIDAQNTMRAVASGKVTAVTRAYVQRAAAAGTPYYPAQPDAAVTSDVGVKIRFGPTGNLDVRRSFTIVADADLDGDGALDLVIRAGADALLWRRGVRSGVWEAEPRRLPIPALAPGEELEAHAADLDGDRRHELVLHVRAAPGGTDRVLLLAAP